MSETGVGYWYFDKPDEGVEKTARNIVAIKIAPTNFDACRSNFNRDPTHLIYRFTKGSTEAYAAATSSGSPSLRPCSAF